MADGSIIVIGGSYSGIAIAWSCSAPDAGLRPTVLPAIRLLSFPQDGVDPVEITNGCLRSFRATGRLGYRTAERVRGAATSFLLADRPPRRAVESFSLPAFQMRCQGSMAGGDMGNGVPPTLMHGCELYRDGAASLVPILLGPPGTFLCPNNEAPCCFALWGECPFFHNHCMLSCSRGKSPAQLFRYLSAKWPAAFNPKAPRPLKIGIRYDIRMLETGCRRSTGQSRWRAGRRVLGCGRGDL
ncbi:MULTISPECIES: ProQ/FINO family protein [unclassified Mesorhizobium]|uniref:ProQ/FINO family protein n=1 Tax=unclassified Mesorhizobium TaxID=325217 RepID=UPI001FDFE90B|nr:MULTISPECIES: ProQ/FINO family protein [unclassified Mesorhizobium]